MGTSKQRENVASFDVTGRSMAGWVLTDPDESDSRPSKWVPPQLRANSRQRCPRGEPDRCRLSLRLLDAVVFFGFVAGQLR